MVTDAHFAALMARKDAQVSELLGRDAQPPASPDTMRLALEAHAMAQERASAKVAANFPVGREAVAREPARSWANDYQVMVGDISLPASLLLERLLQHEKGAALVAEMVSALGLSDALLSYS